MMNISQNDVNVRIPLAFYNFIRNNPDWINRIDNVIISKYKNISDYDFEHNKKLYSIFYKYIDSDKLDCTIREYDRFYDNQKDYITMNFKYSIKEDTIID